MPKLRSMLLLLCLPLLLSACDEAKEAAEDLVEDQAGCSDEQLGDLKEPDLPHCSKAIACCKFLKGECGEVRFFTPPEEVLQACDINEAVLAAVLEKYRAIDGETCPEYLKQESCAEGMEQTRSNYRDVVDLGESEHAAEDAPSCRLIVQETVNRLNDEIGDAACYLPEACERME